MRALSDAPSTPIRKSRKASKLHTEMHALADDLIELCGEPERFATFLGRIKTVGLPIAYQALSELKDGLKRGAVKTPGRWWMWKTKYLTKG